MSRYHQINQEERYEIYALRKAGISQKEVAKRLNRDPSSISRELKRNAGKRSYMKSFTTLFHPQEIFSCVEGARIGRLEHS